MHCEEDVVFPLAEASLREADREALIQAFDQVEKLDPFPGTRETIDRIVGHARAGGAAAREDAAVTGWASAGMGRTLTLARPCAGSSRRDPGTDPDRGSDGLVAVTTGSRSRWRC